MLHALTATEKAARLSAVASLRDGEKLVQIAIQSNCRETRVAAIEALEDQSLLFQAGLHSNCWETRLKAVGKIFDEDALFAFTQKFTSGLECKLAVSKIKNKAMLAQIAESSRHSSDAIDEALVKLYPWSNYQKLFIRLAETGDNLTTRLLALGRIEDKNFLLQYATAGNEPEQTTAVKRLQSEDMLAEVAACGYVNPASDALKRIHSQTLLLSVLERSPIPSIRQDVAKKYSHPDVIGGTGLDFYLEPEVVRAWRKNPYLRHSTILQSDDQKALLEVVQENHLNGSTVNEEELIEEARIVAIYQLKKQNDIESMTQSILNGFCDLAQSPDELYYRSQLVHHKNTRTLRALWWAADDRERLRDIYLEKQIPSVKGILERFEAE